MVQQRRRQRAAKGWGNHRPLRAVLASTAKSGILGAAVVAKLGDNPAKNLEVLTAVVLDKLPIVERPWFEACGQRFGLKSRSVWAPDEWRDWVRLAKAAPEDQKKIVGEILSPAAEKLTKELISAEAARIRGLVAHGVMPRVLAGLRNPQAAVELCAEMRQLDGDVALIRGFYFGERLPSHNRWAIELLRQQNADRLAAEVSDVDDGSYPSCCDWTGGSD